MFWLECRLVYFTDPLYDVPLRVWGTGLGVYSPWWNEQVFVAHNWRDVKPLVTMKLVWSISNGFSWSYTKFDCEITSVGLNLAAILVLVL